MSERWWRRRRRFDPWFGDFFDEANKVERIMDDMIREAFDNPSRRERVLRLYPHQSEGFRRPSLGGSQISEKYEPLVDVFLQETCVVVVAELHGVEKDLIEINALEDRVTISVNSPRQSYYKELHFPARVDPRSSVASYKNGVLEIRLSRIADDKLLVK